MTYMIPAAYTDLSWHCISAYFMSNISNCMIHLVILYNLCVLFLTVNTLCSEDNN